MNEIVIISGKGGTGKTTLTAALASLHTDTVIADCDVDAADLHLLLQPEIQSKSDFFSGVQAVIDSGTCTQCGKCREVCQFDAVTPDFGIDRIRCEGCGVCFHFCPAKAISLEKRLCGKWYFSNTRFGPFFHAQLGIAEANSGKLVALIRNQARKKAESLGINTILIDGSPGTGCPVISSITGASLVIIITEPTISGLHDCHRVLELSKHFHIPSAVVINKMDLNEIMCRRIESIAIKENSLVIGRIPYDPEVTHAMVHGKTVIEYGNGTVSKAIKSIDRKIIGRHSILSG